jgi:hypothetical protein
VAAGGVARGWDPEFESALLQRGVRNELLIDAAPLRGCHCCRALSSAAYGLLYDHIGWRGLLLIGVLPALVIVWRVAIVG